MQDPDGTNAVLITIDICMLDTSFVGTIKQHILDTHGVLPASVCVNASHTHSGPCTRMMNYGFKVFVEMSWSF